MGPPEQHLPAEILGRASLNSNEYAWQVGDIPLVIAAVRNANLVNIGGQLQFRWPDGTVCECYWVEVDTYTTVSETLPWVDRVAETARVAHDDFVRLSSKYDFFEEGRRSWPAVFDRFTQLDYDPRDAMRFVWYIEAPVD